MPHIDTASVLLILSVVTSLPIRDDEDDDCSETALERVAYLGEQIFQQPDSTVGEKLEEWNETSEANPEELGGYAEGDIVFPKSVSRNALVHPSYRWPGGIVPYEIKGSFSGKDLEFIHRAIDMYKKYTCVTFRPRTPRDRGYIIILNDKTGCWSSIGYLGRGQNLNLQTPACTSTVGTPVHELMHAIGFLHEHVRFDRNRYVTVHWENIKADKKHNFKMAGRGNTFKMSYDYRSVMHYTGKVFSKNGRATLTPKDKSYIDMMGQRDGLNKKDIEKINLMYRCPKKTKEMEGRIGTIPKRLVRTNKSDNVTSSDSPNADPELFGVFSR